MEFSIQNCFERKGWVLCGMLGAAQALLHHRSAIGKWVWSKRGTSAMVRATTMGLGGQDWLCICFLEKQPCSPKAEPGYPALLLIKMLRYWKMGKHSQPSYQRALLGVWEGSEASLLSNLKALSNPHGTKLLHWFIHPKGSLDAFPT